MRTASAWDAMMGSHENPLQLWSWDVKKESLKKFGYSGPDLVMECLNKGNLARYRPQGIEPLPDYCILFDLLLHRMIQDGRWMGLNVNLDATLRLMRKSAGATPLPYVFLKARRDIKTNQELLLDCESDFLLQKVSTFYQRLFGGDRGRRLLVAFVHHSGIMFSS